MNAERLLALFDRISEAPDAGPRLRRFILDLAVRGKVIEQNSKDEPASELLKRIQTERSRLVKGDEIRKREPLPAIASDEVPFEVPLHWTLVRLGEALELFNGRAFKPNEWSKSGLPIIRIQNLNNKDAPFNYCDTPIPEKFHVNSGDFLISWSGTPGTSFGAHIWDRGHAVLNQHIFRVRLIGDAFFPPFLKLAINSRLLELIDQAHGGVGLQHITKPKLESLPLTLPPLAEQHRIVAKVDELMALCDRLKAAQAERERRRDQLAAASLHPLNQPTEDAKEFREHARFHLRHLARVTTRPEQIKELRQTILGLAVRGQIVPQDPKDGNAAPILSRMAKDQTEFWEAQGRKTPPFPKIEKSDDLYKVPGSWAWTPMASLTTPGRLIRYGILKPGPDTPNGVPYVRIFEMKSGKIDIKALNRCDPKHEARFKEARLKEGDLIVSKDGTIGKVAMVPKALDGGNITQHLLRVSPSIRILGRYLALAIQSPQCQAWMTGEVRGLALQGINVGDFRQMPVPLPPLAEQHRIVAKVDELMAVCDRLEAQLAAGQTESRRLLEAVLHEALA